MGLLIMWLVLVWWYVLLLLMKGSVILVSQSRESTTTTTTMAVRMTNLAAIVLTRFHALGAKDVIQTRTSILAGVNPRFNRLEHGAVRFVVHIPEGRVMEYPQTVFDYLVLGDAGILPSVQDTRSDVLHDRGRDVAGGFVEDVGEVVLG